MSLDFMRIADDLYVIYVNGKRITDCPLSKEELHKAIDGLDMSVNDMLFIEKFYGGGEKVGASEAEGTR